LHVEPELVEDVEELGPGDVLEEDVPAGWGLEDEHQSVPFRARIGRSDVAGRNVASAFWGVKRMDS
jgi:hypothetical protein